MKPEYFFLGHPVYIYIAYNLHAYYGLLLWYNLLTYISIVFSGTVTSRSLIFYLAALVPFYSQQKSVNLSILLL